MNKHILTFAGVLGVLLVLTVASVAGAVDFLVSASIPAASGVTITATQVNSSSGVFGDTVTALNFDPMSFNSANSIWVPNHYFAIDVGVTSDGIGSTNVTVSYAETPADRPANQDKGLGWKATATFLSVTGGPLPADQTETELTSHGPKKLLKDVTGENILGTELDGGFFRAYIGIYTGNDATITAAGGEPFTGADRPGSYTGTLTVTAVVS